MFAAPSALAITCHDDWSEAFGPGGENMCESSGIWLTRNQCGPNIYQTRSLGSKRFETGRPGRATREIVRWIMHRNVVALADEEYDAMSAPLVDEACRIIRRIGAARAYLLPVIIASLGPYTREQQAPPDGQPDLPTKNPNLHRPHLRIHSRGPVIGDQ